jgi:undecaprenyl-diphosphatase
VATTSGRSSPHRAWLVGATAIAAALVVAVLVAAGACQALDDRALEAAASLRSPSLTRLAVDVTALGATPALLLALALTAALSWRRVPAAGAQLALAATTSFVADGFGKLVLARSRPTVVEHLVEVRSASFPSGHAMSTATVACSIALLAIAARGQATARRVWAFAGAIIVGVAGTRVYLGVHYPSDVIAGALFGLGWAHLAHAAFTPWRARLTTSA